MHLCSIYHHTYNTNYYTFVHVPSLWPVAVKMSVMLVMLMLLVLLMVLMLLMVLVYILHRDLYSVVLTDWLDVPVQSGALEVRNSDIADAALLCHKDEMARNWGI